MSLFRFNSHPSPGIYQSGKPVTVDQSAVGMTKTVTADIGGVGGGVGGFGGGGGGGMAGGMDNSGGGFGGGRSAAGNDLYNPVRDRLDEGSVVEDWIPRDAAGLDEMFRLMYHRDHIGGTIVDFIAETMWSDYDLTGITDPSILNIYRDCLEAIDIIGTMPDLTRGYLVIGRDVSSLIFDKTRGIFKDVVSHDPSLIRITPIPIKGFDPKIDLMPSPAMRAFVDSEDPRDVDARHILPESYLKAVRAVGGGGSGGMGFGRKSNHGSTQGMGGIPLDPVNTLFVARKCFNSDMIGTSYFTRLITFWALEKALINATMTSARRRSRSILHVKAGIDNLWEPTGQELDNIAGMFIQADQDPVGAVVATRTGVDTSEIRQGTDFYKWADEWTLLNEGKLRALGANDALLTGDASYSNQETARVFFMERVANLRRILTQKIFYNRLFPLIARVHGFKKITQAQLAHGIRIGGKLTQRQALDIPDSELICPTFKWRKKLVNDIDEKQFEIFEKLEEKGVPVSLRSWSAAGNHDLDAAVSEMEGDADLRRKIAEWKASYETPSLDSAEDGARLEFLKSLKAISHTNVKRVLGSIKPESLGPIATFPFWDDAGHFGTLGAQGMAKFLNTINPSDGSAGILYNKDALMSRLMNCFNDETQALTAHFLMFRTRLTPVPPPLTFKAACVISDHIKDILDKYASNGNVYQLGVVAQKELEAVARLMAHNKPKNQNASNGSDIITPYSKEKKAKVDKSVSEKLRKMGRSDDRIPNSSIDMISGRDD